VVAHAPGHGYPASSEEFVSYQAPVRKDCVGVFPDGTNIQDGKVTKDMLDLARHIINQKAGHFEPDKFEDQYETALIDLINQKRAGKPITAKERPRGENVVDLMDALRKSIGGEAARPEPSKKLAKKPRKATPGQKEMLMPIAGKKPAKEAATKNPAAKPQRKSA
jgi:DNA end-binding protein Ku